MQAAILRVKLKHLDSDNAARRRIAHQYSELLADLPLKTPKLRGNAEHVYHLYVVQTEDRKALMTHLQERGIYPGIHYPVLGHQMPAFSRYLGDIQLHHAERLSNCILSLPLYPELTQAEIEQVTSSIKEFFRGTH